MLHTLSLRVANKPGTLIRIVLVFSRRGYNIESLVVSPSNDPRFSNMNIVADGTEEGLDQILKQLNKLVDVVHATDRTEDDIISHEMALYKIECDANKRIELLQLASTLSFSIVEIGTEYLILEITGESHHIDNVHRILSSYQIIEVIRTGKVLIARGKEMTP